MIPSHPSSLNHEREKETENHHKLGIRDLTPGRAPHRTASLASHTENRHIKPPWGGGPPVPGTREPKGPTVPGGWFLGRTPFLCPAGASHFSTAGSHPAAMCCLERFSSASAAARPHDRGARPFLFGFLRPGEAKYLPACIPQCLISQSHLSVLSSLRPGRFFSLITHAFNHMSLLLVPRWMMSQHSVRTPISLRHTVVLRQNKSNGSSGTRSRLEVRGTVSYHSWKMAPSPGPDSLGHGSHGQAGT